VAKSGSGNRSVLIPSALALLLITTAWYFLPAKEWVQQFSEWVGALGVSGVILFGVAYIIAVVALAPASLLTVAAGVAFGFWAVPLVLVAATIGATLAFIAARYVVRDTVKGFVDERPKFRAVYEAVGEDGWRIVLLLRLSPLVPFNLQNYFFGVTNLRLVSYAVATFVGIIPGTILYVYLGALGKIAANDGGASVTQWIFFGIGLVATVVVAVIIYRKAKAKLREAGVD
jgi:uncharacterized membrane protein YdjX (TVP38/TMEM64 family)